MFNVNFITTWVGESFQGYAWIGDLGLSFFRIHNWTCLTQYWWLLNEYLDKQ